MTTMTSSDMSPLEENIIRSNIGEELLVDRCIQLPSSFFVLQGISGDGLANTIDSMPLLPDIHSSIMQNIEYNFNSNTEQKHQENKLWKKSPARIQDESKEDTNHTIRNRQLDRSDLALENNYQIHPAKVQAQDVDTTRGNSSVNVNHLRSSLTEEEEKIVIEWEMECRSREKQELDDLLERHREVENERQEGSMLSVANPSRHTTLHDNDSASDIPNGSIDFVPFSAAQPTVPFYRKKKISYGMTSTSKGNRCPWWQRNGKLCVFSSPHVPGRKNFHQSTIDNNDGTPECHVVGTLSPGQIVMVTNVVTISEDGNYLCDSTPPKLSPLIPPLTEQKTREFLQITSPFEGFVLYSRGHYVHLLPGLPEQYAVGGNRWMWRCVNPDGAIIRSGLELNSPHCSSVPHGGFVRVIRKTINAVGLSRLKVLINVENEKRFIRPNISSDDENTSEFFTSHKHGQLGFADDRNKTESDFNTGWISEMLNPLSGQCGAIVQPLPFPVPMLYRVTLEEGAVIRSDVELSSPTIRVAPHGSVLRIIGRSYSEHPTDKCLIRLQLAGDGGYVSERLNRTPPANNPIVELIGIDKDFDVDRPGMYHIFVQKEEILRRRLSEDQRDCGSNIHESETDPMAGQFSPASSVSNQLTDEHSGSETSSCPSTPIGEVLHSGRAQEIFDNNLKKLVRKKKKISTGMSSGKRRSHYAPKLAEEKCLICLTEDRTATIIHGETGHIACCLACARILKARGDRCPVCRLPIDFVIQQFWA